MIKFIKKIIKEVLWNSKGFIAAEVNKEVQHTLFANIGISRLKEVISKIETENPTEKYVSIAELYIIATKENIITDYWNIWRENEELKKK